MGNIGRHWKLSEIAKKHIGDAVRGRKLSDETKKKISEKNKLAYKDGRKKRLVGKDNPFFGKTWTPEHRAKIGEARKKIMESWTTEKIERINKRKEITNSPHPTCQKCGQIIRRHNKMGMCWRHKMFSTYVKERAKQKYQENIDERRAYNREYAKNNKEKKRLYDMARVPLLRDKRRPYYTKYVRERRQKDVLYKLTGTLRYRIWHALSTHYTKNKRTIALLGAEIPTVKEHLEKQFTDGMTWQNHGDWHIDHIIPLASAKSQEEMEKLCQYTNLQPLWKQDNLRKSRIIR